MRDQLPVPPGTVCAQCGATVEAKEVREGDSMPLAEHVTRIARDYLGANIPCGHLANAEWTLDETAGMPGQP